MRLLLLLAFTGHFVQAEIKFDPVSKKFSTVPSSPAINQEDYNKHMHEVAKIMVNYCHSNGLNFSDIFASADIASLDHTKFSHLKTIGYMIFTYLAAFNTPTSDRVIADLIKGCIFGFESKF